MIKIRDLKKNTKGTDFVIGCKHLDVDNGEITSVIGGVASGKTVLSKIISGNVKNYSGSVEISMTEVSGINKKRIGYVPFDNIFYGNFKVREMLLFLLSQFKMNEDELEPKISWFSDIFDIRSFMQFRISKLTPGQCQFLKFFASVLHSPSALIIDEPFNSIGGKNAEKVMSFLEKVSEKDVPVILTTSHDIYIKDSGFRRRTIVNGTVE